jgi:hypothetical protein
MEGAPLATTQAVWGVQIMISAVVRTLTLFLFPSFPLSLDLICSGGPGLSG